MSYRMNSSLNNLVGASERKNKRKKTVVRATRGSEVNISKDALEGGGKIKIVARRNSKININNPSSTALSPSKVAKSDTVSTSKPIKPAKANVVAATPKPKTTATAPKKFAPKPAAKPAAAAAATVPKSTFVPTTQELPTTPQDKTRTKHGEEPNKPTFMLGQFTGLNFRSKIKK